MRRKDGRSVSESKASAGVGAGMAGARAVHGAPIPSERVIVQTLRDARRVLASAVSFKSSSADIDGVSLFSPRKLIKQDFIRFDTNGHALVDLISDDGRQTHCSIDILDDILGPESAYQQLYRSWLMRQDGSGVFIAPLKLAKAVDAFMSYRQRGSVISLQQELENHMRLSMRGVLNRYGDDFTDRHLQITVERAANRMNHHVRDALRDALVGAMEGDEINLVKLNSALDKSRKVLLLKSKVAMADSLVELCRVDSGIAPLNLEAMTAAVNAVDSHELPLMMSSSGDSIYTNNITHSCSWVEGTDLTSHDKRVGADVQALRQIKRFVFDRARFRLVPIEGGPIEARVPSLSPADVTKAVAIVDVADKIDFAQRSLSASGHPGAVLHYGLLTSVNSFAHDKTLDSKNRQRQSTKRILMAMHRFNRSQCRPGGSEMLPFCLVSNIPVNQHTDALRLTGAKGFDNKVLREASLVAELSIIETLNQRSDCLSAGQKGGIESLQVYSAYQYKEFLIRQASVLSESSPTPVYFYQSKEGAELSDYLQARNDSVDYTTSCETTDSLQSLIAKAMYRLHATGKYREPKYGLMVQAMLVFLQDKSMYGCKSANERFKAVEGRVDLYCQLASADSDGVILSDQHQRLKSALSEFCRGARSLDEGMGRLQVATDEALEAHCLYGGGMAIPYSDMGWSPKTLSFETESRTPGLHPKKKNTNYAETALAWRQTKGSKGQSHKGDHATDLKVAFNDAVLKEAARSASVALAGGSV